MRYLIALLLAGCSYAPTSELENQYFQCAADRAMGCDLIAEDLDRRYEVEKKRQRRGKGNCGKMGVVCLSGEQYKSLIARERR